MRDVRGFMLLAFDSQSHLAALEGVCGLDAGAGLDSGGETLDVLSGSEIRIVVRRHDFHRLREFQDFDQVTHPLVAPTLARNAADRTRVHLVGVLRFDDDQVDARHELNEVPLEPLTLLRVRAARIVLLVVQDDRDGHTIMLDAVAEASARVIDSARLDHDVLARSRRDDDHASVFHERAAHPTLQHVLRDREGIPVKQVLAEDPVHPLATPEVDREVRMEQRREKAQARDVVFVQMREERMQLDLLSREELTHELLAEVDRSATRVDHQPLAADLHLDARRVATDLAIVRVARPSHTPELDPNL